MGTAGFAGDPESRPIRGSIASGSLAARTDALRPARRQRGSPGLARRPGLRASYQEGQLTITVEYSACGMSVSGRDPSDLPQGAGSLRGNSGDRRPRYVDPIDRRTKAAGGDTGPQSSAQRWAL